MFKISANYLLGIHARPSLAVAIHQERLEVFTDIPHQGCDSLGSLSSDIGALLLLACVRRGKPKGLQWIVGLVAARRRDGAGTLGEKGQNNVPSTRGLRRK